MLEQKNIRIFFLGLFLISAIYVLFIESERFKSESAVLLKDLNSKQTSEFDLSLFGSGASTQMQDSMILESYLKSFEMLEKLDKKFNLRKYYKSDELDFFNRLGDESTREDFLNKYLENIEIYYDELSGILNISFLHTNRQLSKNILEFILKEAEYQINKYNEINAIKYLSFIQKALNENKISLDKSIEDLENYQNKNLVLNPTSSAETTSGIIASLEAQLVKKKAALQQLKQYMSEQSFDVKNLRSEIKAIEKSISTTKKKLTGSGTNRLNIILFEFEKLKNIAEFEKEKYKQSLVQYEIAKNEVEKDAKTLQIIVKPNLPDGYSIPNRPMAMLDIIIALGLIFGVVSLIAAIIKDHKD